jgi:hypothetical protein
MGEGAAAGAIAAAVIAASATAYSVHKQEKIAEKTRRVPKLPDVAKALTPDQGVLDRQKQRRRAAVGRSDTVLTGPLGLTQEPQTQAKTLLGM